MLFKHKVIVLIALGVALALVFQGLISQTPAQENALQELAREINTLCGTIKEWQLQVKTKPAIGATVSQNIQNAHKKYDAALKNLKASGLAFPINSCLADVAKNIASKRSAASNETVIVP